MLWERKNPGAELEDLDLNLQLYEKEIGKRIKACAVGILLQNLIHLTIYFGKTFVINWSEVMLYSTVHLVATSHMWLFKLIKIKYDKNFSSLIVLTTF